MYNQESSQQEIYEQSVRPLIDASLSGYNTTVLAYGQTGSGKTYTMGSSSWSALTDRELGVMPRAFRQIFDAKMARETPSGAAQIFLKVKYCAPIRRCKATVLMVVLGVGVGVGVARTCVARRRI